MSRLLNFDTGSINIIDINIIIINCLLRKTEETLMAKKIPLTIYLTKENIVPDACLDFDDESDPPTKIEIQKNNKFEAVAYIGSSIPKLPDWIPFLKSVASANGSNDLDDILRKTFSFSAILILKPKGKNRCLIFSFGYGKKFINLEAVEPNFGRNVTLNTVDEKKIQAIRTKSYEGRPWFKEAQASLGTALYEFDLNCDYEILQKVTADLEGELPEEFIVREGKSKKKELLSKKITGYDSLNLNGNLDATKIPALCDWLFEKFNSQRYRKMIPNIDVFDNVRDPSTITMLDKKLLEALKDGAPQEFHLIMPDMATQIVDSYSITDTPFNSNNKVDALRAEEYLNSIKRQIDADDFKVEYLKKQTVTAYVGDKYFDRWTVYKCICWELAIKNTTYVLFGGSWISIKKNFYEKKLADLNRKLTNEFPMHPYVIRDNNNEGEYNKVLASKKGMQLFDKELQASSIGQGIEPCDVLSGSSCYIHIKRLKRSSDLSHLFAQAITATELFHRDELFKKNFLNAVDASNRDEVKKYLEDRKYCICFGIIVENRKQIDPKLKIQNIPAFSIINLSKAIEVLEGRGQNVSIKIQLIEAQPSPPKTILRKATK